VDEIFQDVMSVEEASNLTNNELNAFWFDGEMENNVDKLFSEWLIRNGVKDCDVVISSLVQFRKNTHIKTLPEGAMKRQVKLLSCVLVK